MQKRYNKNQRKASRQISFVFSLPFTPSHSLSLLLFLLLAGCARQGYPTGGPKDEEPPVALGCKPANGSKNIAPKEFYVQFDEYVVLKNAPENVLVSPPLKNKPEFTTKGKGVLVKIKDTLQENTTYLFQFKEAIADFTEGNLLPSYEYVFSTGTDMDTMSLGGQVIDARSGKAWKETVTVMAYRAESGEWRVENDTMACSEQPDFVTRCDKEGHFAFHFIPTGKYRLVAFEDKNRNLRIDATEAAAWDTAHFEAHPIDTSLTTHHSSLTTLYISQPEVQKQRITANEFTAKGRIRIVTQLPMQHPTVTGTAVQWHLNARRDTMSLWCLDAQMDTALLVVSDEGLQDTLHLRFTEKKKGKKKAAGAKEEKEPLMTALCDGNKAYYDDLRLAFANPIAKSVDNPQAEVMYLKDSTVSHCAIALDSNGLTARLETSLKSGEQYRVRIADSLFIDIYGNVSDSLVFGLKPKDYGILSIDIDNKMGFPLVVEVLDKRDTVVQRSTLNTQHSSLRFSHLPSGDYRLRAVIDRNGDGRWTPGDYRQQRQPEQTLLYEKTLSLREKWEMEEHWTVEEKTSKKGLDINALPFMPEKGGKSSLKAPKKP